DLRLPSEPGEAVCDLVDGAVAAHHDEELRAVERGLAGELGKMSLPLAEARRSLEPGRGSTPRELRPAPARRAVRRRRVDEEDRVRGLCHRRPGVRYEAVTTCNASSVIWSTAARISSSVMRMNSPSTTTSETISMHPAWTFRSAPSVKRTAASI